VYTREAKISLTFSFFEASVIVGGDGSHGQTGVLRFHLTIPPAEVARLPKHTVHSTSHLCGIRCGQASVLGTRTYVRMSARFWRALCYRSAEFAEKAVEVFPKQGLCIGGGFSDAPTCPRAAQVGGG